MKTNPIEDLQEIRKMMENSTRFLSLSGLSGVSAGVIALVGTYLAWLEFDHFDKMYVANSLAGTTRMAENKLMWNIGLMAIAVLVLALLSGFIFTWLKARKNKQKLVTKVSFRMLRSLFVPLVMGGLFIIAAIYQKMFFIIIPCTLIFYGMALLNASKYVQDDLKYLALSEMILGIMALFTFEFSAEGLTRLMIYWALGFGFMHIIYGAILYFRYDFRK